MRPGEEDLRETTRQPGLVPPTPFGGLRPMPMPMPGAMPAAAPAPQPPRQPPAPGAPADVLKQKWDELSGPKKILVALLPAILVSLYFLFLADDEPQRTVAVATDAAASAPTFAGAPDAGPTTLLPPTVPPTIALSQLPVAPPPPASGSTQPAQPTATNPAQRTLERQAVDFVASGQYERAAAAYDQLAVLYPDRPAYREAARILRGKLDAGQ